MTNGYEIDYEYNADERIYHHAAIINDKSRGQDMKIEWVGNKREVPKVGILNSGDIREVPNEVGKAYIKQGLAV